MSAILSLKNKGLLWEAQTNSQHSILAGKPLLPFGIPEISNSTPHKGFPQGSINEWRCQDNFSPFSFFCLLAAEEVRNFDNYIAWIGEEVWPSPHYLFDSYESQEIFNKSYFIKTESKDKKLWVLNQTLKTKGIGLIILQIDGLSIPTLKKFSLAAKENGSILFLLRKQETALQNACLLSRWEVNFVPELESHPHYSLKLAYHKGYGANPLEWKICFKASKPEVIKDRPFAETINSKELSRITA